LERHGRWFRVGAEDPTADTARLYADVSVWRRNASDLSFFCTSSQRESLSAMAERLHAVEVEVEREARRLKAQQVAAETRRWLEQRPKWKPTGESPFPPADDAWREQE